MKTFLISAGIAVGAALGVAGTANAVTVNDFNVAVGPTTGNLQLTRLIPYSDLACPDAACSTGLVPSPRILDYSALVRTPATSRQSPATSLAGFQGYNGMSWTSGAPGRRAVDVFLDLFTYAPGTDVSTVARREVADTKSQVRGARTKVAAPVVSGAVTTQTATITFPGGFGERRAYAWATANGSTSVASVVCAQSQAGKRPPTWGSSCKVATMVNLASAMATRAPATAVPNQDAINRLLPATLPEGLTPEALVNVPAGPLWAEVRPRPALNAALGGTSGLGVQMQFGVRLYQTPASYLVFPAFVAGLQDASVATPLLRDGCKDLAPGLTCTRTKVPGVNGYVYSFFTQKDRRQVQPIYMGVRAAGAARLMGASCSLRTLTPMRITTRLTCSTALEGLARVMTTG